MFTTCPNCSLNLAVTAADLRVGQGYVRCGRCVSVFNALISLADGAEVGPDEAQIEDTASATQSRPSPRDHDEFARLDLDDDEYNLEEEAEADEESEIAPLVEATAEPDASAPEDIPDVEESSPRREFDAAPSEPEDLAEVTDESRDAGTGTFETIVLEGDTILQTEEFVDEAEVDEQLKALAQQLEDHDAARTLEEATPRPAPAFVREEPAAYEVNLDPLLAPAAPRRAVPWMMVAGIALAVLLVAQIVHHWRFPLAARMPWIGAVYSSLGAPLAPAWDLGAYDVRQLGAAADPANAQRIEVRASVRNGATRPQPAPVLRVILQDRFGNELGRYDRNPADYLRGVTLDMLAADQRVDASFWLDDPEQKAIGFELDACLRSEAGVLRCATDSPPR
jgi:predicted Zn finger-like uncharacterized protein